MALESGATCAGANGGVGCDVVTVYDGAGTSAAVLGVFSGNTVPETLLSTGNAMTVRFQTDTGNYGFTQQGVSDDPGFYVRSATAALWLNLLSTLLFSDIPAVVGNHRPTGP